MQKWDTCRSPAPSVAPPPAPPLSPEAQPPGQGPGQGPELGNGESCPGTPGCCGAPQNPPPALGRGAGGQEQLPTCVPTLQSTLPRAGGGLGTLGLPTAARVPGQPLTTSAPPTPIRKRLVPPVSVGQVWRGAAGNLGQMQPQSRSARDQDLKCTFLGLSHPIRNRWSPYLGVERAGQISGLRVISDLGSG